MGTTIHLELHAGQTTLEAYCSQQIMTETAFKACEQLEDGDVATFRGDFPADDADTGEFPVTSITF